jgi:hypothetical protein
VGAIWVGCGALAVAAFVWLRLLSNDGTDGPRHGWGLLAWIPVLAGGAAALYFIAVPLALIESAIARVARRCR